MIIQKACATSSRRPGLSLLEVMISMTIFLIALTGLSRLIDFGAEAADEIQWQNEAVRLAESKLNEVRAGVVDPATGGSGTFDEAPEWQWQVTSEQGSLTNLHVVTVRVYRDFANGKQTEAVLTQMIFDPLYRGGLSQ